MDTIAISDARSNLPTIISEANQFLKRFAVTVGGKAKAVIMSFDELESLEETAEIMATPGAYKKIMEGINDVKKGRVIALKDLKI